MGKKILIVSSSLDHGGAQKIISNITTHLPDDWDIDILINSDQNIKFPYEGRIISLDIKEPKSRMSLVYQGKVLVKRLRVLRRLKKKNRYAACISFLDSANVANILTGNTYCKVIINIVINMSVATQNEPINRYIINPLTKLLYNRADKIITVSEDVKQDMISHFGIKTDRIKAIYTSVTTDQIEEKINKLVNEQNEENEQIFSKKYTVITAGRLEKQKGQWHLIRAFHKVVKKIPEAKLVIFGEGSLKEYLERLISDYNLENNVFLYGFSNEYEKYVAESALFVFPSLYEGFGTALQEAMVCGIACMATDYISGAREMLSPEYHEKINGFYKGEYGIVTECCSENMLEAADELEHAEKCLADAILEILENDGLREEYAIKAKARSQIYDVDEICKQWIHVIEDMD